MTRGSDWYSKPLHISIFIHLTAIVVVLTIAYKPKVKKNIVKFDVYENPKIAPQALNLNPPKQDIPKPKELPNEAKKVFGLTKKSLTTSSPSMDSTVEAKLGNTVAKEQDNLKLDPKDADSLPIPADDYLVTSMPVLLSEAKINYPEEAKKAGIEGPVILDLLIDQNGQVRDVTLIKGPGFGLNEAALNAIKAFKFRPAKVNDQNVAVKIRYTYRFILENR